MDYKNIKFRAWYKEQKKMYIVSAFDIINELVCLHKYKGIKEDIIWISFDEVELMMFTGQQDKHGKDIYEGDIVSYTEIDGYSWETNRKSRELVTEVTVSIKTEFEEYYGGEDTQLSYENIEIIGNKYENPEFV